MTLLGFASYLLGVAILVGALTFWLELLVLTDRRDPRGCRREALMALLAPLVLLAHGHAFLLFGALATLSAVATGNRMRRAFRLRSLLPALALAAWVAWRERGSVVPAGSVPLPRASLTPHFQGLLDKLSLLATPTLFTRTGADLAVGLVLWATVVSAAWATARSLRKGRGAPRAQTSGTAASSGASPANPESEDSREHESQAHARALLASAAGLALAFALLPHSIGWFGFVDGRLVLPLLLLAIASVRRPALGPRLAALFDRAPLLGACAMLAIVFAASYAFQREAAGWRQVLAGIPARSRLLSLPIDANSAVLTAHPFVHYDKLVMADRPAVVSDLWYHQGSGVFPRAENPALALPASYSGSDLRWVDWPAYHFDDWDYVLIRTRPTAAAPPIPAVLTLKAHEGGWWLYRTQRLQGP
jgi:hypothetical protein